MKKLLPAALALALALCLLCAPALAAAGDVTTRAARAYSDAELTHYIGTVPAYTAVAVRSYGSAANIYVNGTSCYISASALLNDGSVRTDFVAALAKGTRVYQRPSTSAESAVLKKAHNVSIIGVQGDWALVQADSVNGLYAFVKTDRLVGIYNYYANQVTNQAK